MIRWSNLPLCLHVALRELRIISTSYAVLLVLVGGVFVYGLLYNYMYAPNVVHDVPVAVVCHSHSALSRQYVRLLDATPEVAVTHRVQDMLEAKELMCRGRVYGILYLPRDFEVRLLRDELSTCPFYAATDAFLYYEAMVRANLEVMEAIDGAYRVELMPFLSLEELAAVATQHPVTVVGTALYNPIEGYGVYLIPAVLMIIIFQTLMLLVAMLAGGEHCHGLLIPYARIRAPLIPIAFSLVVGKSLAYAVLYGIFAFFLVALLPLIFNIPHGAMWFDLVALLLPYILSTACLGLALSRWYNDAEAPVLLIAFFSVGLIFLSGISYPLELIPWYWQVLHYLLPAASAVLAYVQLVSMDASLHDVWPQLVALWAQTVLYFVWALYTYNKKLRLYRG